jgi:hypothetical protein
MMIFAAASPPRPLTDIYGKIGKTIYFPAGAYYIADSSSFGFDGKVVGHQYFNTNPYLVTEILIETNNDPVFSFECQEFSNLNIETQGSGYAYIYIEAVKVSGCNFNAPIYISPLPNPVPPKLPVPEPLATVTIQGCQFISPLYAYNEVYGTTPQYIINGSVFGDGIGLQTNLSDLIINSCYYRNSSGDYVAGIPPVATYDEYSISAMSPSVKPITIVSGTLSTNPAYLLTGTVRLPVTLNPTSTASATVSVEITDQYNQTTTTTMASAPAGSTAGIVQTITFDVPPRASYTVTATNATLEEGTISYNSTAVSLGATSAYLS